MSRNGFPLRSRNFRSQRRHWRLRWCPWKTTSEPVLCQDSICIIGIMWEHPWLEDCNRFKKNFKYRVNSEITQRSTKLRFRRLGTLFQGLPFPEVCSLANHLTSLHLSYLIFKLGIIIPALPSPGCNDIKWGNVYKGTLKTINTL